MKTFILLASLVLSQVLGDIWLSKGMKAFGEADPLNPLGLMALIVYLFTNPWIFLGIATLVFSLFMYYVAVSRLDLSYVLPIHASSYVLNALFAWLILSERVSVIRWSAALTITLGVFIVSISDHPSMKRAVSSLVAHRKRVWLNRSLFFLMPLSLSIPKMWGAVMVIVLADAGGDLFNAIGMKRLGAVKFESPSQILRTCRQIITNPWILRGIACQTVAFFGFISVLSWADISLVRPATALTYVFTLLGAVFILKEKIEIGRLIGIIIVGIGVALVALD